MIIIYNLFFVFGVGIQMISNFYMQTWAYSGEVKQQERYNYYIITITGWTLASAIIVFVRCNIQYRAGTRVGRLMHNILIAYVFRAPINLFFDVTPIGKILNRFSKDLALIDEQIYFNFGGFLACIWQVVACLVIAGSAVPLILVVMAIFAVFSLWLFVYSMKAYKDCYRIESVTMSPILSYFQETFNGNSVIRSFNKEVEFRHRSYELINNTTKAN